nr:L200 [uncultured bacterium]
MKTGCQAQIIRGAGRTGPIADSSDAIGDDGAPDAANIVSATVKDGADARRERGQELVGGRLCTIDDVDRERSAGLASNDGTHTHSGSSCPSQMCAWESASGTIRIKNQRGN